MYAVIFKASIDTLDDGYHRLAAQMRALALQEYGCLEFTSVAEGKQEISISYWNNKEQIERWKQDAMHQVAQQLGKSTWYDSYHVQIAEIINEYRSSRHDGVSY
ncbi:MAG: hypothetical protein PVG66_14020 [Chromatiales bacterium]|jgi:heme-degrading monooxygenase HmoA